MRISTRILAFILMALMLVGMIPFALFAEETEVTEPETTVPEIDTSKPYPEQLVDYLNSVGGTLLYSHDFEGLDEYITDSEDGLKLPSYNGGGTLTMAPKDDALTVKDGAALIVGTENPLYTGDKSNPVEGAHWSTDPLFQVTFDAANTKGKILVLEASYKGHENGIADDTPLLLTREDNGSNRFTASLVNAKGGYYVTAKSGKVLAPMDTDKFHTIKVVVNYAINTAFFYVDGEFVCYDKSSDINYSNTKYGVAAPTMARCVQLKSVNANEGIYIGDFYVYAADSAYGVENVNYGKGFLADTLIPYLSETGNRLIAGTDFENTRYPDRRTVFSRPESRSMIRTTTILPASTPLQPAVLSGSSTITWLMPVVLPLTIS